VAGSAVDYVYDHAGHELAEVNTSGSLRWLRTQPVNHVLPLTLSVHRSTVRKLFA
jgi:hypothetical protein